MWEQLKRITKERSAICLFGSEPFSSHLRLSNLKMFKYDWVWSKPKNLGAGFLNVKNAPLKNTENISIFSGGVCNHASVSKKRMNYFPQGLVATERYMKSKLSHKITAFKEKHVSENKKSKGFRGYPSNVICFNFNKLEKNRFHPTQKPVALLEYLIKTYTLE